MKNFYYQLNEERILRWVLILTLTFAAFFAMPAQAFVDNSSLEVLPVLTNSNDTSANSLQITDLERYQVNGLNTRLETALPWGRMQMVGGLFSSNQLLGNDRSSLNLVAGNNQQQGTVAMLGNLFSAQKNNGQSSQLFFQTFDYSVGGLKLTGNYADTGTDFQGLDALSKQLAPTSARLLSLGTTVAEYGLNYQTKNGMEFSSSSNSRENHQPGHAENGLTRTNSAQKFAMQFSPRMRFEFNNSAVGEEWLPGTGKQNRSTTAQALKFTVGLGAKSEISFGQSSTATKIADKLTADTRLRNISLKWLDIPNFSLKGSFAENNNGLTEEENTIWNMESSWQLDPRLSLTGKWQSNQRAMLASGQQTANDLLQLRLSATLSNNLRFSSSYGAVNNPVAGDVVTYEQQINWQPKHNLALQTIYTTVDSEKNGATYTLDQSSKVQIGTATRSQEVALHFVDQTLPQETHQQRSELSYRRALGNTPAAGSFRMQVGTAGRTQKADNDSASYMALQAVDLPIDSRTSFTLGYYNGARYGAGILNYRNWGHRIAGNNAALVAQDFVDYQEYGGTITHRPGKSTAVFLKQMLGEEAGNGNFSMLEYGFEKSFGTLKLQASENHTLSPGKGAAQVKRNATLWKITAPIGKPLPEWAKKSLAYTTVTDSAKWGFNKLPAWQSNAAPAAGITAEKRQVLDAGKPRAQYTVQGSVMLGKNSYLLARYEDNPCKPGTVAVDKTQRTFLQYTVAAKENLQLFSRYTNENRHDNATATATLSLGITGILSNTERMQLQLDLLEKQDGNITRNGNALILAYDRKVSPQDSLALRLRLTPETFVDKEYPVVGELTWQREF